MKYLCRGKRVFVGDERRALSAQIDDLLTRAEALPPGQRGPLEKKAAGKQVALAALDGLPDGQFLRRAGCGCDLSDQIAAIPDDGEVYEYECPVCGNVGTVQKAPVE